jgi:hypothetical protein
MMTPVDSTPFSFSQSPDHVTETATLSPSNPTSKLTQTNEVHCDHPVDTSLSKMMNAHQLQQMQLSQLAHPSLVAQVQQQVAQQQQQAQAQVHSQAHVGGDSDDSSGEEHYDLDDPMQKQTGKPWVPSIEDPNYFEDLTPEEIYDSFFSIRRMGFIANRIIRKLNETKHIVSSKILEKRKKLKAVQRKQFEQLSPAGVEYLKVLLKMGKSIVFFSHCWSL